LKEQKNNNQSTNGPYHLDNQSTKKNIVLLPSWELTYPLPRNFWVDDVPFPKVGYGIVPLEGISPSQLSQKMT